MRSVGVRELRENTSKIIKEVVDRGEVVEIRRHGRPVARLVPLRPESDDDAASHQSQFEAVWADLDRIAEEIAAKWPAGVSAADAVAEDRE